MYDIFDYSDLIGKIITKFKSRKVFAEQMHMDYGNLTKKLNGKMYWTTTDIYKACVLLNIDLSEVSRYFFTLKVEQG